MGDYDDLPYIVIERRSGGAGAFLWGALLGAGVALLLAPRSGQQTQEEIRAQARRVRDAAEGRMRDAQDNVTGAVHRTRDRIQDRIDTVRDTVESRTERARQAIEAGRQAAREARSELERRVADAKQGYAAASDAVRRPAGTASSPPPMPSTSPAGGAELTEVVVEEAEGRPDLG